MSAFTTRPGDEDADLEAALRRGIPEKGLPSGDVKLRLSRKQAFYLFVMQGCGGAILDALANFGIACAIYRTTTREIRVWPLSMNTIAGDLGVTVIIQSMLTTLIVGVLVRGDMKAAKIEPFSHPWPSLHVDSLLRGGRFKRNLGRAISFFSPTQVLSLQNGFRPAIHSLFMILLRGFFTSIISFIIFWPLAIAVIAPLYGGLNVHGTWVPEITKAIFGGILGLFQTPLIAALILGVINPPTSPLTHPPKESKQPPMSIVTNPASFSVHSLRHPSTHIRTPSSPSAGPPHRQKIHTTTPISTPLPSPITREVPSPVVFAPPPPFAPAPTTAAFPSSIPPSSSSIPPPSTSTPSITPQPPKPAYRSLLRLARDKRKDRKLRESITPLIGDGSENSGNGNRSSRDSTSMSIPTITRDNSVSSVTQVAKATIRRSESESGSS
ncbi:hypothetical protein M422DRAFT_782981 [Sphaerobolus stellatus SS14]|uniref:Uncharacterized protein n=1 Tax=Sphaerobolus stellatus (strain SS14) TaxID=990650 RepID=A0A0C9TUX0_SPHS4|nr:hypothetical protein M422DRAFT_782981 [Sphaerobolus stellatus SS14]